MKTGDKVIAALQHHAQNIYNSGKWPEEKRIIPKGTKGVVIRPGNIGFYRVQWETGMENQVANENEDVIPA